MKLAYKSSLRDDIIALNSSPVRKDEKDEEIEHLRQKNGELQLRIGKMEQELRRAREQYVALKGRSADFLDSLNAFLIIGACFLAVLWITAKATYWAAVALYVLKEIFK